MRKMIPIPETLLKKEDTNLCPAHDVKLQSVEKKKNLTPNAEKLSLFGHLNINWTQKNTEEDLKKEELKKRPVRFRSTDTLVEVW